MKINQMNRLIEGHRSRTKFKFLLGKLLQVQSELTALHEQLMEELAPDDPLFNDYWNAEVNIAVDECSSEVNEYLLSRVNDPPSDVMSNTALVEDCLEKSEKNITEREQLNQLTIKSNQQMVHADVHDREEAVSVRKSSGAFKQLRHPLEIQVDKQSDREYRTTLSAQARPFVALQANKERVNYFNEEKERKSQPDSRLRNIVTMDLPDNYSAYKKEEKLSADAWIDQMSVHVRDMLVKSTSMDHLSMT